MHIFFWKVCLFNHMLIICKGVALNTYNRYGFKCISICVCLMLYLNYDSVLREIAPFEKVNC